MAIAKYDQGISIVILNLDKLELINPLVTSLVAAKKVLKQHGAEVDIIIGDTGSTDQQILDFYKSLGTSVIVEYNMHYHYSKCNNVLFAKYVKHDKVLFLNNDVVFPNAIIALVTMANLLESSADTGIIGSYLFYPNGLVQHAGINIINQGPGQLVCYHQLLRQQIARPTLGYSADCLAVTGASFMVRSEVFFNCLGFDEDYATECQDVALCLAVRRLGYKVKVVYCGEVIHLESATRSKDSPDWNDRQKFASNWQPLLETLKNKLRLDSLAKDILIIRDGALGDVLCIEPIIRKLKAMGFNVYLETGFAQVHFYNKNLTAVFGTQQVPPDIREKSIIINLNLAYERRPFLHIIDAYIQEVQTKLPDFQLTPQEKIPVYDSNISCAGNKNNPKTICVNSEGSWAAKTYDRMKMKQFIAYLKASGYFIIEIGWNRDNYLGVGEDYYGLQLHDSVKVMAKTDMYIGMDGGLMHLAQAIGLPMFIIFGCVCPNFIIHNWDIAKVLWKNTDELSCAGCHHRRSYPRPFTECDKEMIDCLNWPVETVIETFETVPFGNKPVLTDAIYQKIGF